MSTSKVQCTKCGNKIDTWGNCSCPPTSEGEAADDLALEWFSEYGKQPTDSNAYRELVTTIKRAMDTRPTAPTNKRYVTALEVREEFERECGIRTPFRKTESFAAWCKQHLNAETGKAPKVTAPKKE